MLTIENLRGFAFGPINLTVAPGRPLAIMGESGSGKSMLLRAIADLDPAEGTVRLDETDRRMVPAPLWRTRVAYLPADSGWWTERVADHFDDWPAARPKIESLGLPADCGDWSVDRLSTGERQRLALVRALVRASGARPRVLLADEPASGLDERSLAQTERLLADSVADGLILLLVTHDPAQAARLADHRLILDKGRPHAGTP